MPGATVQVRPHTDAYDPPGGSRRCVVDVKKGGAGVDVKETEQCPLTLVG